MKTYRIDRRYVLPLVGYQLIAAGITAVLAFLVWGPIGVLTGLLVLNAGRLAAWPPVVVRTDPSRLRVGGRLLASKVDLAWSDVEDVAVASGRMTFERTEGDDVVLTLTHLGSQSQPFIVDVHERLNAVNGYRRFDPNA